MLKIRRFGPCICAAAAAVIYSANAAWALVPLLQWDTNGTQSGFTTNGRADGTWGVDAFWASGDGTAPTGPWVDGSSAKFPLQGSAVTSIINVAGTQRAIELNFGGSGTSYVFEGDGKIVLGQAGVANGAVISSIPLVFNCSLGSDTPLTFINTGSITNTITLGKANTFSGPLTFSGRLNLNASGAAGTGTISLNSNNLLHSTAAAGSVITSNATFTSNSGGIFAPAGVTQNIAGKISGSSVVFNGLNDSAALGTVVLSNPANDFTGTALIARGTLVLANDHVLGGAGDTWITNFGSVAFQSETSMTYSTNELLDIRGDTLWTNTHINNLGGDNTFLGRVSLSNTTMNNIGVAAGSLTLGGSIINGTASPSFTKKGNGLLVLSGASGGLNNAVTVSGGRMLVTGNADLVAARSLTVSGAILEVDQPQFSFGRLPDTIPLLLNGGDLIVNGGPAAGTMEQMGQLRLGAAGVNNITVNADAARPATLSADSFTRVATTLAVFRAPGLGSASGAGVGQIKFATAPTMAGAGGNGFDKSIMPGALAVASLSDQAMSFATYDASNGVLPLSASDYSPALSSGETALNNVALSNAASLTAPTTINSLRLQSGGGISIATGGVLTVNSGMLLVDANSTIGGGSRDEKLKTPTGTDLIIAGAGDLLLDVGVRANSLVKSGPGSLTLTGANTYNGILINEGTVITAAPPFPPTGGGQPLGYGPVTVNRARLVLNASANLFSSQSLRLNDGAILSDQPGGSPTGGNPPLSVSASVADGARVTIDAVVPTLAVNIGLSNPATPLVKPTIVVRGGGLVTPTNPAAFLGNFELHAATFGFTANLGDISNTITVGPEGAKLQFTGLAKAYPIIVQGDTTMSGGGLSWGPLTVAAPATISNVGTSNLIFSGGALNADVTINTPSRNGPLGFLWSSANGPHHIVKIGAGDAGTSAFNGSLAINEGTIGLDSSINSNLTRLSGSGRVRGRVAIVPGGHVAPGVEGIGTLTFERLQLDGTAAQPVQMDFEGGGGGFDQLFSTFSSFIVNGPVNVNLTSLGGAAPGDFTIINYSSSTGDLSNLSLAEATFGIYTASLVHDAAGKQFKVHLAGMDSPPVWQVNGGGSWSEAGNWQPGIPDNTEAHFLGALTQPAAEISLDGDRSVKMLRFDNANRYRIVSGAGGGQLTIGSPALGGAVMVDSGAHEIAAPVVIAGNTAVVAAAGASLRFTGALSVSSGKKIYKSGTGEMIVDGAQSHGAGSGIVVKGGGVILNGNAGSPATAAGAAETPLGIEVSGDGAWLRLGADQDLAGLDWIDNAGVQTIDLASPAGGFRALRVYAADLAAAKKSLFAAIAKANRMGTASPLDGIVDSGLVGHGNAAVGIATVMDAHGDAHVLIRPTRIGDLNLDGMVSIADFITLAANFNKTAVTWAEGDVNFDGAVTISDFIDLASNFNGSYAGETLPISAADAKALSDFAEAHGVAAPEPGMIGLLGIASVGSIVRRRRR